MNLFRIPLALIGLMLIGSTLSFAQTSAPSEGESDVTAIQNIDQKRVQLVRMAEAVGLEDLLVDKITESLAAEMTSADSTFESKIGTKLSDKIIDAFDFDEVIDQVAVPVFGRHFTVQELKAVADFLETDLGSQLVQMGMSGEEVDFQSMMMSGAVSEEDAHKLTSLMMTIGPKMELFKEGDIGAEFESSMREYGEGLAMRVIGELMMEASQESTD